MESIKGSASILYIVDNGIDVPVACLTSNGMSESSETIETTTRDNAGWKTALATKQSYTISVAGLATKDDEDSGNSVYSYRRLRKLKRDRIVFDWKIKTLSGWYVDSGKAIITDISFDDPVDDFISFSATLEGFGKPNDGTDRIYVLSNDAKTEIYSDLQNNLIKTQ